MSSVACMFYCLYMQIFMCNMKMATIDGYAQRERWRYVVMMSKFFHQFIQQGFLKSFGILIPFMVIQLDSSYAVVGFVSSLFFTSTFIFCPVARVLSTRFGCRKISIVGGCMVGVSVPCLFFLRSPFIIGLLMLFAGIGNSFIVQTGYVIMQEHFGDQYGSANAVPSLGSSLGSLIIPLLSYELLQAYGLWGTFLIIGGMMAHFIPIAATYRSPRPAANERTGDTNFPVLPVEESRLFTGESKSAEGLMEDTKDTHLQVSPTAPAERKDYAYQVLSRDSGKDEEAPDMTKEEKIQEQEEKDKHTEPSSSSTSPLNCLVISRFSKDAFKLVTKTLALDDLWKEKEFTFLVIPSQMLADMIFTGWCLFVVTYGLSVGIDEERANYLLVAGVAGSLLSRTLCIVFLRVHKERTLGLYAFFYLTLIIGLFLYPISSSFAYLIFCSTLSGFSAYGVYTTFYGVLNVSVSGEHFSGILAITFCILGIMMAFSSLLAGRIYDVTHSLTAMFMLYGGMGCIGAILIFIFIYRRRKSASTTY